MKDEHDLPSATTVLAAPSSGEPSQPPALVLDSARDTSRSAQVDPYPGMAVTPTLTLTRPLGRGGMGAVWHAHHAGLRVDVVVKFISPDLARSPDAMARFRREAAAASRVRSPHVVQILDHGVMDTGLAYIVMELLDGRDLSAHLAEHGPLRPAEVVAIAVQLARALTRAHERGIVHRDIKPSNVFLCDAGGGELFVKLLDFGIAKSPDQPVGETTKSGSFVGSPHYMSPEQIVGSKDADYRSDLWSLGVLVFETLTGTRPFQGDTVGALAVALHRDTPPLLTSLVPELPAAVDGWFARACARDPADRFGSAKELAETLSVALTGATPSGVALPSIPPRTRSGSEIALSGPASQASLDAIRTGTGVGFSVPPGGALSPTVRVIAFSLATLGTFGVVLAVALAMLPPASTVTTNAGRTPVVSGGVAEDSVALSPGPMPAPARVEPSSPVARPSARAIGSTAVSSRSSLAASAAAAVPSALSSALLPAASVRKPPPVSSIIIYSGKGIE